MGAWQVGGQMEGMEEEILLEEESDGPSIGQKGKAVDPTHGRTVLTLTGPFLHLILADVL